ncbi:auxin-responsive protein IAA33-like isoform X3 [Papaver somniferum]|uniref:auxin-responsive protein IAA33-like isoform X3 n=1 Tax=Papaver somniferum TaxID=3469 RepID=UPI000E6F99F2|nr:auxin-responsive protein IAA33-like isoform X3 [Papaver somniferum]
MFLSNSNMQLRIKNFHGFHSVEFDDQQIKEDETLLKVIPKVTVVLEGVIGDHHLSTLVIDNNSTSKEEQLLSLSNAIPGHLIAYEDMEDDLLLAGDLNWKDFVRLAKRIRIIPVKEKSRRGRWGGVES